MTRHSNTYVFNIDPDNWDECASGPTDESVHGEHVGEPWQGIGHGGRGDPYELQKGDLVLARRTSGNGRYNRFGVKGLWEFQGIREIGSQDEVPWDDNEYAYALYCSPIQREFDEIYIEDFNEHSFTSNHLQGAVVSLRPEHKRDYLRSLLTHDPIEERARSRIHQELGEEDTPEPNTSKVTNNKSNTNDQPSVWIEKTAIKGRDYKQSGELALGNAIFSPEQSKGGADIYHTLREADPGDIVLHILQDRHQLVGASLIQSELQTEFDGPANDQWTQQISTNGGYLRRLSNYTEFKEPIQIYEGFLNESAYQDRLEAINESHTGLFYDRNHDLVQGGYFTSCPETLVDLLADTSPELAAYLEAHSWEITHEPEDGGVTVEPKPELPTTEPKLDSKHPLANHIRSTNPSIYKFTAPPDYWLTAYEHAAVGFEPDSQDTWKDLEPGDVLLFHSRAAPGWEELDEQNSSVIGGGIIGNTSTKTREDSWWYDEQEGRPKDDTFPYLVSFEHLYTTGNLIDIDFTQKIFDKEPTTINAELTALTANSVPFAEANDIYNQIGDSGFPHRQMVTPLSNHEQVLALVGQLANSLHEAPPVALNKAFDGELESDEILDGLYFPNDIGEEIIAQIGGALRSGKHVILTGPPGTGKTEIARRIGTYLVEHYPYLYSGSQVTTATADWSTFDTVGGYMPGEDGTNNDQLEFTPGLVLNRFKTRSRNIQRNEPLVIDELNRADIDKAFGQLFTVLSGQQVHLPYTKNGNEVEIAPLNGRPDLFPHQYGIPASWSLFATLNTYDKTSLYEMSYAFMRRFAFIRVPVPTLDDRSLDQLQTLIGSYTDPTVWDISSEELQADAEVNPLLDVARVWQAVNTAIDDRAIGPAIVKDILGFLAETPTIPWQRRLTQAVISYIFPQLEGVPKRSTIVKEIADIDHVERDLLEEAARDILQTTIISDSNG